MTVTIIAFPPAAGGNHLKNLLVSATDPAILEHYSIAGPAHPGGNLNSKHIQVALNNPNRPHILHGHFGEIMSQQESIRKISDKKFILLGPETPRDIELLNRRYQWLTGEYNPTHNSYFIGEQVFLYEWATYHRLFDISSTNIMNIPIAEWFAYDISDVLDRVINFLKINIDRDAALKLHSLWISNIDIT